MKTYCIFTVDGVEQCGSDAYYRLDSRNALSTQIADAIERAHQLRFVKPHYNGFNIFKCKSLLRPIKYLYKSEKGMTHAS